MNMIADVNVSRETLDKLNDLSELILKWTKSINLISAASKTNIWDRHIVDSAQLYHLAPQNWSSWTDIGSGGGLPALVIAAMDEQKRPMTLIESDKRKCLFLTTAKRELDLNINVINGRIEDQDITPSDVLSARALAPLTALLTYAKSLLRKDGTALFPKGATYQEELDQAAKDWQFDATTHTSKTHAEARVIQISRIEPRER